MQGGVNAEVRIATICTRTRRQEQRTRASNQMSKSTAAFLVEHLPWPAAVFDTRGVQLACNPSATAYYGGGNRLQLDGAALTDLLIRCITSICLACNLFAITTIWTVHISTRHPRPCLQEQCPLGSSVGKSESIQSPHFATWLQASRSPAASIDRQRQKNPGCMQGRLDGWLR